MHPIPAYPEQRNDESLDRPRLVLSEMYYLATIEGLDQDYRKGSTK